jgi:hypothetical protein
MVIVTTVFPIHPPNFFVDARIKGAANGLESCPAGFSGGPEALPSRFSVRCLSQGSNKNIDQAEGPGEINNFFVDAQSREVTSSTKKLMVEISLPVPRSPRWGFR